MNLGFPSRFLKKLDIYQQIRSGQGISKHKKLWEYEAAFLQTSHGKGHQYLNSCLDLEMFKDWIKISCSLYKNEKYEEILGNLFWRGYIDIFDSENNKIDHKKAYSNNDLASDKKIRPTADGLLIGEVLSEINNKKSLLKYWNRYRYNIVIDIFWLLIFLGLMNIFFNEKLNIFLKTMKETSILVCNFDIGHNILVAFLVFVFWPFLCWLYREIYLAIEDR